MKFADAEQSYEEANYIIFGIPYEDIEMSFRKGASEAPDFIRYVSWDYESYNMENGVDLQDIAIHDAGNLSLGDAKTFIKKVRNDGKLPIIMGGAHSITPPMIFSLDENFGVVILDAHMDFREEYLGDKTSHACTARRIFERIGSKRIISFGIRSASKEEIEDAGKLAFKYYLCKDFKPELAEEIHFEKIYLSVDMDVFDPCYAPGVSNPEPMGLGYEVFDFIKKIANRVIALDVVEVCPPYDDGRASLLAAKIIRDFISWRCE